MNEDGLQGTQTQERGLLWEGCMGWTASVTHAIPSLHVRDPQIHCEQGPTTNPGGRSKANKT